ncbi:uncharacterized protein N7482_002366 [Penicillium canariense]|uniref:G-protein coupled receptors family 2 profile 2 domain-containing protein n=1 Tax=Penicillium canariense TaxID=189055 RepID=A0A9W9IHP5_9EURO|nr:uncharacterized protein N7482_002366 [Penicillium canariense]KAJ5176489.1 hypothetical protein N7482_002366 [Penicillium canariense]
MVPSERQLSAISITERICSAVSLASTSVIVVTFISSPSFRKPINRLVFYASWGNIMANIATLISQSGIHAGVGSPLCQFQAFLIQWFMPADALWTFAMACNVYLTFFHQYNSEQLRQLEWKYVLWCWIALPWDYLRIAIFYGPVWFVISLTFAIYLRAGTVIYQKRRQLRALQDIDSLDTVTQPDAPLVRLASIQVTSEIACSTSTTFAPYSVTIEGGTMDPISRCQNSEELFAPVQGSSPWPSPPPLRSKLLVKTSRSEEIDAYSQRRATATENTSAAWAYTKYAMLFFIALLVTWV